MNWNSLRIPLRVVFYRDGRDWVAHCLEFDLMGDGPSREDALKQLVEAIGLQVAASIEFDNPENLFRPADGKYFAMFAAGKDVAKGLVEVVAEELKEKTPTIDGFENLEIREAADSDAICTLA